MNCRKPLIHFFRRCECGLGLCADAVHSELSRQVKRLCELPNLVKSTFRIPEPVPNCTSSTVWTAMELALFSRRSTTKITGLLPSDLHISCCPFAAPVPFNVPFSPSPASPIVRFPSSYARQTTCHRNLSTSHP